MTDKNDKRNYIPNSFQTPNIYIDEYLHMLSGSEIKVLLYAMRRIFGFHKQTDRISVSQFCNGITGKEGNQLDHGTGLSRATVVGALNSLQKYGLMTKVSANEKKENEGAEYALTYMPSKESPIKERYKTQKQRDKEKMEEVRKHIERPEEGSLSDRPRSNEQNGGGLTDRTGVVYSIETQYSSRNTEETQLKEGADAPKYDSKALLEEAEAKSKMYKERLAENLEGHDFKKKSPLDNINDYPPEVQNVIKQFCKRWRIFPPPKGTSLYGKWIKDAKEVKRLIENTGLTAEVAMAEAYYDWKTPHEFSKMDRGQFGGKFTVTSLGSLTSYVWERCSAIVDGRAKRKTKTYTDQDGNKKVVDID